MGDNLIHPKNININIKGTFTQLQKHQARERRRKFLLLLDLIGFVCIIFGIFSIIIQEYMVGVSLFIIGFLIILYLIFRKKPKRFHKKRR